MMPTDGQIGLLMAAAALLALSGGLSLAGALRDRSGPRIGARVSAAAGLALAIAVLAWHGAARGGWMPLEDNFDAFASLAVLLALFVLYVQRVRPLPGLDWFVGPIVLLLLAGAIVFGRVRPHTYTESAWSIVHRVTSYGGAAAFALAAAVGAMYLIANRRLRRPRPARPGSDLGSLERLERLMVHSVTLGFALLSVALLTGIVRIARHGPVDGSMRPKIWLTVVAWVVYALVLHAPINPRLRGRKAAALSLLGFALMIGTLIAAQFVGGPR